MPNEYDQPHPGPVPCDTPQVERDAAIRVKHWDKYSDALGDADAWETPWHVTEAVHGEQVADRVWGHELADRRDSADAQPMRLTPTETEDWRTMRVAMVTAGIAPSYITDALEAATLDLRARVAADPPKSDQALEEALVHVLGLASVIPTNDILAEVGRLFRFWSEHNPTERGS